MTEKKRGLFLVITAVCLISVQVLAEPVAGIYDDGLVIAYDRKTNKVSGYFESYSGWDARAGMPRFSCIFYLAGKASEDKTVNIRTWYPGAIDPENVISGVLEFSSTQNDLSIKLDGEHGGCWNVQHFTQSAVFFSLSKRENWVDVRMARSVKTFFYNKPDLTTRRRSYVVKGNSLKVSTKKPEWLSVEYQDINSEKITRGWVKENDLFSAEPFQYRLGIED